MSAKYDLLNSLRGQRISNLPQKTPVVELDASDGELEIGIEDDSLSVEDQVHILTTPIWSQLKTLLPSLVDREILLLMLEGVRDTAEYATVLEITNAPEDEQEAVVKRNKDRIKKTLQRHIPRSKLSEL